MDSVDGLSRLELDIDVEELKDKLREGTPSHDANATVIKIVNNVR